MQTLEKLLEDSPPLQVPCHLHRRESPYSRGLFPGFTCGNINENTNHHVSDVAGGVCVMIPAIWRRFWQRDRKKQKDMESLVALTLTLPILEGEHIFFLLVSQTVQSLGSGDKQVRPGGVSGCLA